MTRNHLAFVVAASYLLAVTFAVAAEKKPDPADEVKLTDDEKEVIDLTNAERKAANLPPLAVNKRLMESARGHAANMAALDVLNHTLGGKDLGDRAKDAGYGFRWLGENIAWNQQTPKEVVGCWMNSPGHRSNILNDGGGEIGVAVAKNSRGERYWVQVFGGPAK